MSKHGKPVEPVQAEAGYTTTDQHDLAEALAEEYLAEQWEAGQATGPMDAFIAGFEAAKGEGE